MLERSRRSSLNLSKLKLKSRTRHFPIVFHLEMPRTKVAKRKRLQVREEAEREDQLKMAQMKLESALEKIDELGRRSMQKVHNQLQLIMARTHDHVLHMKWSDFMQLNLQHFEDYRCLGE